MKEFELTFNDITKASYKHEYDHIQTNIKLASNYKLLKEQQNKFRGSPLNTKHSSNLDLIKSENRYNEETKALRKAQKISKWITFRQQREDVIDRYITVKRKTFQICQMIGLVVNNTVILNLRD